MNKPAIRVTIDTITVSIQRTNIEVYKWFCPVIWYIGNVSLGLWIYQRLNFICCSLLHGNGDLRHLTVISLFLSLLHSYLMIIKGNQMLRKYSIKCSNKEVSRFGSIDFKNSGVRNFKFSCWFSFILFPCKEICHFNILLSPVEFQGYAVLTQTLNCCFNLSIFSIS